MFSPKLEYFNKFCIRNSVSNSIKILTAFLHLLCDRHTHGHNETNECIFLTFLCQNIKKTRTVYVVVNVTMSSDRRDTLITYFIKNLPNSIQIIEIEPLFTSKRFIFLNPNSLTALMTLSFNTTCLSLSRVIASSSFRYWQMRDKCIIYCGDV
jgi:hypothetical protein